jgi:hypothetical protein
VASGELRVDAYESFSDLQKQDFDALSSANEEIRTQTHCPKTNLVVL